MVRLFAFALKEVLANIMALARQEPQAALVLLEHYLVAVSGIQDDVHDETGIPEIWVDVAEKALSLAAVHALDPRHFIAALLDIAATDDTCHLVGEADLSPAVREWVRAEAARLASKANGERRERLSSLALRLEPLATVH